MQRMTAKNCLSKILPALHDKCGGGSDTGGTRRLLRLSRKRNMDDLSVHACKAGGHGIAWDGPFNKELRRLVEEAYATGKIIAAVDHGPAAIVHARNIKLGDPREGTPLVFRKDVRAPAATYCPAAFESSIGLSDLSCRAWGGPSALPQLLTVYEPFAFCSSCSEMHMLTCKRLRASVGL